MNGSNVPVDGLVMNPSELVASDPDDVIPVSAYYVPCGTAPTADGTVTGTPNGTLLGSAPVSIKNTSNACNQEGFKNLSHQISS